MRRIASTLALASLFSSALLVPALAPSPADGSELPSIDSVRGVRSARIAHMEGDHARELETLRQMAETFPADLGPVFALLCYFQDHDSESDGLGPIRAQLRWRLAEEGDSVPLDVLSLLAAQLDDQEALGLVADELERRVAGSHPDFQTLEVLYRLRVRQEDDAGSIAVLEKLVRVDPSVPRRWHLLRLYRRAERWQEATAFVQTWLAQSPSTELRQVLIELLGHQGRLEELGPHLEKLLEECRAEPMLTRQTVYLPSIRRTAWNLRDAGFDEAAKDLFRRLAELDPEDEESASAQLHLYGSEDDLRRLQASEQAKWNQEDDPQALFEEGTQRLTAGDAEAALPLLQRAAPGLPGLEPAWYNLGMAAYRLELWDIVADAFGHAVRLNDSRAHSFLYRGLALEKLNRCAEAVTDLERALDLDASFKNAHYYLAACYRTLGRTKDAQRHSRLYQQG